MSDYATVAIHYSLCCPRPALKNPALARCCKAWKRAYRAKYLKTKSEWQASDNAAAEFRAALPPLTTLNDCRDFVACVTFGILIKAIAEKDGGKLLYAAQIALSSFRNEQMVPKAPASSPVQPKSSRVRPEKAPNGTENSPREQAEA
jgi:hypothetical protein